MKFTKKLSSLTAQVISTSLLIALGSPSLSLAFSPSELPVEVSPNQACAIRRAPEFTAGPTFAPGVVYTKLNSKSLTTTQGEVQLSLDSNPAADLAAISNSGIYMFKNFSGGVPGSSVSSSVTGLLTLASADLDGDSHTDLVSSRPGGSRGEAKLYWNSNGTFASTSTVSLTGMVTNNPLHLAIANMDHDQDIDISIIGQGIEIGFLRNSSPRVFSAAGGGAISFLNPTSLHTKDLNNDGRAEVIITNIYDGFWVLESVSVFTNTTQPTGNIRISSSSAAYDFGDTSEGASLALLDSDSHTDIAAVVGNLSRISLLHNNGAGSFPEVINRSLSIAGARFVQANDLTADGRRELIAANATGAFNIAVQSQPRAYFTPYLQQLGSGSINDFALLDVDGDSDLDIVVASSSGGLQSFINSSRWRTFCQ